jgi:NADH dehydrogenase FAD-containing subunit
VSSPLPTQVVIAGAGAAGLETLLALHALAGPRVTTTVLAPNRSFSGAAAVGTPFGHGSPPQHDVQAIVAAGGAHLVRGTLDVVDADERSAVTREGEHLMSDALLELEVGRAGSIAFVCPQVSRGRRRSTSSRS